MRILQTLYFWKNSILFSFLFKFRSNFQRNQFQAMRSQKQPFWLAENNDFGNTIETVPLIGELLLEEVKNNFYVMIY